MNIVVGLYGDAAGYQISCVVYFCDKFPIKGLDITEIDSYSILEHRNNEPIRRDHYV